MSEPSVQIDLTADEALVLFGFLQRFSDTDKLTLEDQAEERALWNLTCRLEKQMPIALSSNCADELFQARARLRDEAA